MNERVSVRTLSGVLMGAMVATLAWAAVTVLLHRLEPNLRQFDCMVVTLDDSGARFVPARWEGGARERPSMFCRSVGR